MSRTKTVDGITYRLKRRTETLSITDEGFIWVSKTGEKLDLTEDEKQEFNDSPSI